MLHSEQFVCIGSWLCENGLKRGSIHRDSSDVAVIGHYRRVWQLSFRKGS
jgi:hypothetical protein